MTDQVTKTHSNSTFNLKYDKYPLIDSIFKAITIDGLAVVSLLSIPHIPYGRGLVPMNPLPVNTIALMAITFTAAATPSYYVRTAFRDYEHEYHGGLIGGCLKYAGREVLLYSVGGRPEQDPSLLYKCAVGGGNGAGYETMQNIGMNTTVKGILSTVAFESFESSYTSYILNNPILENVQTGAVAGAIAAGGAEFIYVPYVDYVRKGYDILEDSYLYMVKSISDYLNEFVGKNLIGHIEL